MTDTPRLSDYPLKSFDKLRYGDTDKLGHVNNAVFSTMLETGRVEMLLDPANPMVEPGSAYVIARLAMDYRGEIRWPGEVGIGTRVLSVGRSSITLQQALFQDERCVATAETVIVLMDETTRKSRPLPAATLARLEGLKAVDLRAVP